MPVPSTLADLSTTAASNSPAGSENVFPALDDYLRAGFKFSADLNDLKAPKASPTFTGTATAATLAVTGNATVAGTFAATGALTGASTGRFGGCTYAGISYRSGAYGGAGPNASADEGVLEGSGNAGLSILTPSASIGYVMFGDEASSAAGQLRYNHADDTFAVITAGAVRTVLSGTALYPNTTGGLDLGLSANAWGSVYASTYLSGAAASASVPVYSFGGDPDTGYGRSGADTLALIAAGSAVITASSTTTAVNTAAALFPNISTTASAANAFLNSASNNSLLRSTSSLRYKTDVRDMTEETQDKVLSLRPVAYKSRAEADDPSADWYGLIAEEVAAVEPRLVHYAPNESGQSVPDGVQYDRIAVFLLGVVKRLNDRVNALEAK